MLGLMRDIENLFMVVHSDVWAWPMEEIVIITSSGSDVSCSSNNASTSNRLNSGMKMCIFWWFARWRFYYHTFNW